MPAGPTETATLSPRRCRWPPGTIGYVAFEEIMNRAFSDVRCGADVKTTMQQAQDRRNATLALLPLCRPQRDPARLHPKLMKLA